MKSVLSELLRKLQLARNSKLVEFEDTSFLVCDIESRVFAFQGSTNLKRDSDAIEESKKAKLFFKVLG